MAKSTGSKSVASMVAHLSNVLSDTYILAIKTHAYHWNVSGPLFPQLHVMFEAQYDELLEAADELAERIRALGEPVAAGVTNFMKNTAIKDNSGASMKASAMIADLVKSHETLRDRLKKAIQVSGDVEDNATEDMLISRLQAHEKTIWMLRSQLD